MYNARSSILPRKNLRLSAESCTEASNRRDEGANGQARAKHYSPHAILSFRNEYRELAHKLRASKAMLPRAEVRAKELSRLPGTKTTEKSWKNRSRSANEAQTYEELTEQARALVGLQPDRPSVPVRACANASLKPPRLPAPARQSLSAQLRAGHSRPDFGSTSVVESL